MISTLRGEVIDVATDRVVLEVHGVGYEVLVSELDIADISVGESLQLNTYFHVRENAQELFGFVSTGAKQLFQQLISVNGVGPKGAMAIMALGAEADIRSAIAASNIAYITGASGVGKKAAEKIVIDLKDKVGVIATGAGSFSTSAVSTDDEAFTALQALGYSAQQAKEVLAKVPSDKPVEDRVRLALKELAK